jgi:hypothetical protein
VKTASSRSSQFSAIALSIFVYDFVYLFLLSGQADSLPEDEQELVASQVADLDRSKVRLEEYGIVM